MLTIASSHKSKVSLHEKKGEVASTQVSQIFKAANYSSLHLPCFLSSISAGFPSPADEYIERPLDLNEHLIDHPAATFFLRVSGDSMVGAGIHHGDMLIVDKSLVAKSGDIVIAAVDGQLTVKRLLQDKQHYFLVAEHPDYPSLNITDTDTVIWGVVTSVVHYLKK